MNAHADIPAAVDRLKAGGLVAFPTETVYGLGAMALNAGAVARVFALKGRPANNPLIVHVDSVSMARALASAWPIDAEKLAGAFWPGPLSLVLPKAASVPGVVTGGGPNVAIRCPDHPLTLELIRLAGPLVGPSANPSGGVSPTTAEHVRGAFTPEEVLVLDGGPCRAGIESTVVSLVGEPTILRPGVIGPLAIQAVIGRPVARAGAATGPHLESPGCLELHYAPRTPSRLVDERDLPRRLSAMPGVAAVLAPQDVHVPAPHRAVRMPQDADAYASALYASLRAADALGASEILILRPIAQGSPEERAIWEAVLDRLGRACAPR